jgi:hypothetical protein
MIEDMNQATQVRPSSRLQLPVQAAPIDRNQSRAAAVAGGPGVEAADTVDDIVKVGVPIVKGLMSIFSDRALKRDLVPVEWSR